jgi:hypothetical protein
MPLVRTPARLTLLHACDQYHFARVDFPLTVTTVNCVATLKVRVLHQQRRASYPTGMVRVFRQKFTLDDAIGSHACSLEALTCV